MASLSDLNEVSTRTSRSSSPPTSRGRKDNKGVPFPSLAFAGSLTSSSCKSLPSLKSTSTHSTSVSTIPSLSSSASSSASDEESFSSSQPSSRSSSPATPGSSNSPISPSELLSSSPIAPFSSAASYSYASCAFPDWPKCDTLSPTPSCSPVDSALSNTSSVKTDPAFSCLAASQQANSFISDEDLLDLATLPLYNNIRIPVEMLVAKTPESYADRVEERRKRKARGPQPILPAEHKSSGKSGKQSELAVQQSKDTNIVVASMTRRRRRSSPLKRKKVFLGMSPIAEVATETE